jgi:hypothetical protein
MRIVDQHKIFAQAGREGVLNPPGRQAFGTASLFNRI